MIRELFRRLVRVAVRGIGRGDPPAERRASVDIAHRRATDNPILQSDWNEVNTSSLDASSRATKINRSMGGGSPSDKTVTRTHPNITGESYEFTYETVVVWRDGDGKEVRSIVDLRDSRQLTPLEIDMRARDAILSEPGARDRVSPPPDTVGIQVVKVIVIGEYVQPIG